MLRKLVPIFCLSAIVGCASVDFDAPKTESRKLSDTEQTNLGMLVRDQVLMHPGKAGFFPISDGVDSLAARLQLAEHAEKSIDAQYFLIYNDIVGNLFIDALLAAANRGVRVRFLLDDVLSKGLDPGLATLNTHPNFEVRVFNPFAHRTFRALDGPTDLGRITRRMHNKSFTVDNQVSIIGGRNMANEYFGASREEIFGDLDVLTVGPTVNEVSDMFDTYWNHAAAVPIDQLAEAPGNAAELLASYNEMVRDSLSHTDNSFYADALAQSFERYMNSDGSNLTWAEYDIVFDAPDKSQGSISGTDASIVTQMRAGIGEVTNELFVVTAYLVLDDDEIETFQALRNRGVEITFVTNSLASNNHTSAHGGYMPARKALLEMGANIYEVRAYDSIPSDGKPGKGLALKTLHAKSFAVDREKLFIGSFNWNQRSVNRDTELGVIIESAELAEQFVERISSKLPEVAYRVTFDEDDDLRWTTFENGTAVSIGKEPQTGFWRRFSAGFMRLLPIKSQL